jgi:hypothetical protein
MMETPTIACDIVRELTKDGLNEALLDEGFRPKQGSNDWLHFKREGKNYSTRCFEEDQTMLVVMAPRIYEITEKDDRLALLETLNRLNADICVGKLYIHKDAVWATVEVRHLRMGTVPNLLNIYIDDIDRCVSAFFSEYDQPEEENSDHSVH